MTKTILVYTARPKLSCLRSTTSKDICGCVIWGVMRFYGFLTIILTFVTLSYLSTVILISYHALYLYVYFFLMTTNHRAPTQTGFDKTLTLGQLTLPLSPLTSPL